MLDTSMFPLPMGLAFHSGQHTSSATTCNKSHILSSTLGHCCCRCHTWSDSPDTILHL